MKCPGCGSEGFEPSLLGSGRCTFCDGTYGGHPPSPRAIALAQTLGAPSTASEDQAMAVLIAQAAALRDVYLKNRGTRHEFVCCSTPERGSAVHQFWQELSKALDILDPPRRSTT